MRETVILFVFCMLRLFINTQILLAIYLTILIFSAVLLVKFDAKMVMALLMVQIVYKVLSPIMVGTLTNPVIISNLFIAAFHAVSVWKIIVVEKIQ